MHIVSWNVAGLSSTVYKIHKDYDIESLEQWKQKQQQRQQSQNDRSSSGSTAPRSHAFEYFLQRHQVDILCVQEHKIPLSQLKSRSESKGCATIDGYESFWSRTDAKGMNGVVTFVKRGLVRRATVDVFAQDEELNSTTIDLLHAQGRCVMTDHGSFCIFNVYVPCNYGHNGNKMIFLQALRRAMQRVRKQQGKAVILVGDLNIAHRPLDVFWSYRTVSIEKVREDVQLALASGTEGGGKLPEWKMDIHRYWDTIEAALATRKVIPRQTSNSITGEKHSKFVLTVSHPQTHATIQLGKPESTEDDANRYYNLSPRSYIHEETKQECLICEANVLSVGELCELMTKIAFAPGTQDHEDNVDAEKHLKKSNGTSSKEPNQSRRACWTDPTLQKHMVLTQFDPTSDLHHDAMPTRQWLNHVLVQDGMVDPFRWLYPEAKNRFTCWNQYTNRRYENEGSRIDYTLVDLDLTEFVRRGGWLRCADYLKGGEEENQEETKKHVLDIGTTRDTPSTKDQALQAFLQEDGTSNLSISSISHNPPPPPEMLQTMNSEEAAWHAATASGRFKGASFEGGGIAVASKDVLDTQFGRTHTGIIYTPPSYSDHVGVSLLLRDDVLGRKSSDGGGSDLSVQDEEVRLHTGGSVGYSDLFVLDEGDKETKKTQPHKSQPSISAFFGGGSKKQKESQRQTSSASLDVEGGGDENSCGDAEMGISQSSCLTETETTESGCQLTNSSLISPDEKSGHSTQLGITAKNASSSSPSTFAEATTTNKGVKNNRTPSCFMSKSFFERKTSVSSTVSQDGGTDKVKSNISCKTKEVGIKRSTSLPSSVTPFKSLPTETMRKTQEKKPVEKRQMPSAVNRKRPSSTNRSIGGRKKTNVAKKDKLHASKTKEKNLLHFFSAQPK